LEVAVRVGDIVKVNDKSEWQDMYGIIDRIHDDIAFVYCVTRPGQLHPVPLSKLIAQRS
jgi:hypothetical protein